MRANILLNQRVIDSKVYSQANKSFSKHLLKKRLNYLILHYNLNLGAGRNFLLGSQFLPADRSLPTSVV